MGVTALKMCPKVNQLHFAIKALQRKLNSVKIVSMEYLSGKTKILQNRLLLKSDSS
jgi:hypothetical protein